MSHTIGQIKQNKQQSKKLSQVESDSLKPEELAKSPMLTLSDADYEFLFNQLLEGISHGWHDRRIVKFFTSLGDRSNQKDWVAWLERLKVKASALPSQSKRQLGVMMIRLGELTRSTTEADKIGAASHRIGKELLFGNVEDVWEYVGPDLPLKDDRSKQELSERLPSDFNALGFDRAREEIKESLESQNRPAAESRLDPVERKNIQESATLLWEYVGPDSPEGEAELELAEIPTDDALTNAVEEANKSLESQNQPAAESRLDPVERKNIQESESLTSTAIPDELTADLVDFPESIPQTKQTNPNTIFSSKSTSSLSSSKQQQESKIETSRSNLDITEINLDKDESQIASSMDTETELEAFDIARIMNLIQEDEELARQISQKLNSAIAKPQDISLDSSSLELIQSWFNLGLKQVSVGEFGKAIASWEKALKINPNLSEAWHNRGSALGRLGNYQAAIESFENALTIDPDNYQAWNDRAHALYQLQNWKGAADSWSNAIKIMPGNHLFWYNRACALEHLEKWDEAIASHEKALEIVPDFEPGRLRYINLIADSSRSN